MYFTAIWGFDSWWMHLKLLIYFQFVVLYFLSSRYYFHEFIIYKNEWMYHVNSNLVHLNKVCVLYIMNFVDILRTFFAFLYC